MNKSIKLSPCQKQLLIDGYNNKSSDHCACGNIRTMRALMDKNLANYTSGFGRKWGAIIELTENGMIMAKQMVDNDDPSRTL